jgi:hypothetical protein
MSEYKTKIGKALSWLEKKEKRAEQYGDKEKYMLEIRGIRLAEKVKREMPDKIKADKLLSDNDKKNLLDTLRFS